MADLKIDPKNVKAIGVVEGTDKIRLFLGDVVISPEIAAMIWDKAEYNSVDGTVIYHDLAEILKGAGVIDFTPPPDSPYFLRSDKE